MQVTVATSTGSYTAEGDWRLEISRLLLPCTDYIEVSDMHGLK